MATLGTRSINAPHGKSIRSQVSDISIGLDNNTLDKLIGKYVRTCLLLACREMRNSLVEVMSSTLRDNVGIMGFRSYKRAAELDRATRYKSRPLSSGGREATIYLDEDELNYKEDEYSKHFSPTLYNLFGSKKSGRYDIYPKNVKFLSWNPQDEYHRNIGTPRYVAKHTRHPYFYSKTDAPRLLSKARNRISVSKIFRDRLPALRAEIERAINGK